MVKAALVLTAVVVVGLSAVAQTDGFKLALPDHPGQLRWSAEGFKIIQSSAKPSGQEIGLRGKDGSGRLTFLGFLFLFPEKAPLASAKCRDGVLEPEKKSNATSTILKISNVESGGIPVSLVNYTEKGGSGKTLYIVRGFVATSDICGDLEFYSDTPITAEDTDLKNIFASFELDEKYVPSSRDAFLYAQMLYQSRNYKAAAPIFETALVKLKESPGKESSGNDTRTMGRVMTDQAGMSYGMSGDIRKARAIFEKAIVEDPDYPMYYYNLACADAEEKNLVGARSHLQQAFARKANVIPGEAMPDPTKDDSFTPYRDNREFWTFLENLRPKE